MPPPASYVTITNPPLFLPGPGFEYTVSVAEFNVANEIWFRYDTGSDPEAFGWFIGESTGFSPATNLYESDGTTLVNGNTGSNTLWWPLANNSTYYVRIRKNGGGALSFPFNCLFEGTYIGLTTVPDGSWIVNDDSAYDGALGFPSAVYNSSGEFIGFLNGPPAGEIGDSLPDGTSLWHDRFGMYGGQLALFNSAFGFVDDLTPSPALSGGFPRICNDGTYFYVIDYQTANVYRVDPVAATISAAIGVIPWVTDISGVGVSRDGTKIYWAEGDANGVIREYTIGGGSVDLYTIPGFVANDEVAITGVNGHPGEILCQSDGTLVTWWHDYSDSVTYVLHLAANGTLLNSIAFFDLLNGYLDHIHYSPNGANFIHVWLFDNASGNTGQFGELNLTTGTFSLLFTTNLYSLGETLAPTQGQIFGPSASCTVVTYKYQESPPPVDAEIIVIKQVVSADGDDNLIDFEFDTGGLSPVEFTLRNAEQRLFSGLIDGIYSVVERVRAGFTTGYSVSNGDPNTAISVTAGDSVTVTVTNTKITTSSGGIYKLVPGKRNDTLWTDVVANETQDVKIPDPTIRTALIGE